VQARWARKTGNAFPTCNRTAVVGDAHHETEGPSDKGTDREVGPQSQGSRARDSLAAGVTYKQDVGSFVLDPVEQHAKPQ
jgi:hypothetical protein